MVEIQASFLPNMKKYQPQHQCNFSLCNDTVSVTCTSNTNIIAHGLPSNDPYSVSQVMSFS